MDIIEYLEELDERGLWYMVKNYGLDKRVEFQMKLNCVLMALIAILCIALMGKKLIKLLSYEKQ